MSVLDELRSQWSNPGDILSLLLLVGGDIVQKALAQLVGVRVRPFQGGPTIYLTPVAFSFGWVAYTFSSLMAIFGDRRLMPDQDTSILVLNCDNGYVRDNNSWVLSRLLRDHESRVEAAAASAPLDSSRDPRRVSLKVDIFTASAINDKGPRIGRKWIFCWGIIVCQQVLAVIPWIKYRDWGIFMVTICGTAFALLTGALPQWAAEKWSAGLLRSDKQKAVALTRGNGHQYVMLILGYKSAWDMEAMSSARLTTRPETRWVFLILTVFWTLLLITVSGLKEHTWFLIGVGGLGMLQNVYVAATTVKCEEFDIRLEPYADRSTITGYQMDHQAKKHMEAQDPRTSEEDSDFEAAIAEPGVSDVMGTLMELEKTIPKAGAALLPIFFPGSIEYEPERLFSNREKRFWKLAFRKLGKPVTRYKNSSQSVTIK
jgi:hypothetical protein